MNNKLIKTNTIWYKIRKFFTRFFIKKNPNNINELQEKNITNAHNIFNISLREEIAENNRKNDLAQKLLDGELGSSELTDKEVDEMTQYFKNDIQEMDTELMKIKKHILQMKKQINQ